MNKPADLYEWGGGVVFGVVCVRSDVTTRLPSGPGALMVEAHEVDTSSSLKT